MKNCCLSALAGALLLLHVPALADEGIPSVARFPVERLDEARRALDAARGNEAAVKAWLAQGREPGCAGIPGSVLLDRPRGSPARVRGAHRQARTGVGGRHTLQPCQGQADPAPQGQALQRVLNDIGLPGFIQASFSSRSYALGKTIRISDTVWLTVEPAGLTLWTPEGTFSFWTSPLPVSGEWIVDGTEPLTSWSVKGNNVKVRGFEDAHLSLLAVAPRSDSDQVSLIIRGIPSFSPLTCAILYDRPEVLAALLEGGASASAQGPTGETALHVAAAWGRAAAAEVLLKAGADVNVRAARGVTPLIAALDGPSARKAAVRLESESGTQELVVDSFAGVPPAGGTSSAVGKPTGSQVDSQEGVLKAREGMAAFLLERGADPSLPRENGENALFWAARKGRLSFAGRLLEAGLDIDARDANAETAVFAAARVNSWKALEFLLERGADPRHRNNDGKTLKRVARESRAADCVGILEYREPVHWSLAPAWNVSWANVDGYDVATGFGGALDVHIRLSRLLWLTAEAGYTQRGTLADTTDPWLPSPLGEPYYKYHHVDLACLVEYALGQGTAFRASVIAGLGYELQAMATIQTDSGLWEPVDISDQLASSGPCLIVGMGASGFFWGGILVGLEFRYMRSLAGEWTSRGGNMGSWIFLARVGS